MATSRDSRFMLAIRARQELEALIGPYYNYSRFTLSEKLGFIKKAGILSKDDINIMYAVMKEGNNYAHQPNYDRDEDSLKSIIFIFNSRKDYIDAVLKAHTKPKVEVIDVKPIVVGRQRNELIEFVPKPKVKPKKKLFPINIKKEYFDRVRSAFLIRLAIYVAYIWFNKLVPLENNIDVGSSAFIYCLKKLFINLKNEIEYFIKFFFNKKRSITIKVCYATLHMAISYIVYKIFKFINRNDLSVSNVSFILAYSILLLIGASYTVLNGLYIEGFFVYIMIGCGIYSEMLFSGLFVLIDLFIVPFVLKRISHFIKVEC